MNRLKALVAALAMTLTTAATAQSYELDLGGVRFDPRARTPQQLFDTGWNQPSNSGPAFRLVQFSGPMRRGWLSDLRAAGLTPVQYIYPYSYVVWGDAAALASFADHPRARWTGDFLPAFKVQPEQRRFDATPRPTMLLRARNSARLVFDSTLARVGGQIEVQAAVDAQLEVVQLLVPGSAYADLAALPDVYTVQEVPQDGGPRSESSNQAVVGAYGPPPTHTLVPGYADWLEATGYDGQGVIVGIVDGGVRTTHLDLASRMLPCTSAGGTPTSCTTSNDSHGTHVAGAVAGTATTGTLLNGFLRGQGIAPGANLVQQRYPSFMSGGGPGGMIANGMLTIFKESALSQAVLTNNSWGPGSSPRGYDIPTQQIDIISRDANPDLAGLQPVLAVWSIMNGNGDSSGTCAPSSLGSPDEAKNLFAVGSTKLLSSGGVQLAAIFDISGNSAHGNACDGRRVPHIVAPGCYTDSTASSSNTAHSFSGFCGTSMASPVVSGSVALFIEKYRTLNEGATPSVALIKAVFTAPAMNLQGYRDANNRVMGHRPDRFQGYGRLDLDAVMNPPQPVVYIEQGEAFTDAEEEWTATYSAADPEQSIRIMLSWTDAKGHGLGGSTPAWVNNLDLSVQAGGDTYAGNDVGSDGWSQSGGAGDLRNNLEGVFLSPEQHQGEVQISVKAIEIAADALNPHVAGEAAQDFALVCYNCLQKPLLGAADLGLELDISPDPVPAGTELTLTADIYNRGADPATGVLLRLTLPSQLTVLSSAQLSGAGDWSCTPAPSGLDCAPKNELPVDADDPVSRLSIQAHLDLATKVEELQISGRVSAASYSDANPTDNLVSPSFGVSVDKLLQDGFE